MLVETPPEKTSHSMSWLRYDLRARHLNMLIGVFLILSLWTKRHSGYDSILIFSYVALVEGSRFDFRAMRVALGEPPAIPARYIAIYILAWGKMRHLCSLRGLGYGSKL